MQSSARLLAVDGAAAVPETPGAAARMPSYDVRLRRELTHRRLVVSMVRRFLRVVSLHVLDGALVAGVVTLLARLLPAYAPLREFTPAIVAVVLLSLNALRAYEPGDARRDVRRQFSAVAVAVLILGFLGAFPPNIPVEPLPLLGLGAATLAVLAAGRKLADEAVREAYKHGIGLRRALMVGSLDEVGHAILQLRDDRNIDQYLVGHVAAQGPADPTALGGLAELPRLIEEHDVQEIIVTTHLPAELFRQIADCCFEAGAALFVIPSVVGSLDCRAEPLQVAGCPLLRMHPARLEFPALLAKRGFDLALATLALLLTAPLMLLVAAAIKLDSPGPVFFKAKRVGLGGQLFDMWKFRSMYADAERREQELAHLNIYPGGTFKIRDDPRVTRVGRWLRRSSLDELPQLFNVLIGNMSLVGPRPALPADIHRYRPHHFERLTVIPGITGPWQVGGRNLVTDFETIIRMERSYIRSWSLLLDVKILLRTPVVVVRGEGAY